MNILILCTHGKNRSKYLAEYLSEKGYHTDFIGVNHDDATEVQKKIDTADLIITVHGTVQEKLLNGFQIKNQKLITLDVDDRPEFVVPEGKKLDGEEWLTFQKKHVYPKLEKQIKKYLPL